MKVHRITTVVLLAIVLGVLPVWYKPAPLAASETDSLGRGKLIFERNCAGCHGLKGKGDGYKLLGPEPADLTVLSTSGKSNEDLLKTIHEGKPNMPAWKPQLSEANIRDVLAYVRSLAK